MDSICLNDLAYGNKGGVTMGGKLLWTSVTVFLVAQAFAFPAANIVAAIFAIIGCVLMWLDK